MKTSIFDMNFVLPHVVEMHEVEKQTEFSTCKLCTQCCTL